MRKQVEDDQKKDDERDETTDQKSGEESRDSANVIPAGDAFERQDDEDQDANGAGPGPDDSDPGGAVALPIPDDVEDEDQDQRDEQPIAAAPIVEDDDSAMLAYLLGTILTGALLRDAPGTCAAAIRHYLERPPVSRETRDHQRDFLSRLAQARNVKAALDLAMPPVSRATLTAWRDDPGFDALYRSALEGMEPPKTIQPRIPASMNTARAAEILHTWARDSRAAAPYIGVGYVDKSAEFLAIAALLQEDQRTAGHVEAVAHWDACPLAGGDAPKDLAAGLRALVGEDDPIAPDALRYVLDVAVRNDPTTAAALGPLAQAWDVVEAVYDVDNEGRQPSFQTVTWITNDLAEAVLNPDKADEIVEAMFLPVGRGQVDLATVKGSLAVVEAWLDGSLPIESWIPEGQYPAFERLPEWDDSLDDAVPACGVEAMLSVMAKALLSLIPVAIQQGNDWRERIAEGQKEDKRIREQHAAAMLEDLDVVDDIKDPVRRQMLSRADTTAHALVDLLGPEDGARLIGWLHVRSSKDETDNDQNERRTALVKALTRRAADASAGRLGAPAAYELVSSTEYKTLQALHRQTYNGAKQLLTLITHQAEAIGARADLAREMARPSWRVSLPPWPYLDSSPTAGGNGEPSAEPNGQTASGRETDSENGAQS